MQEMELEIIQKIQEILTNNVIKLDNGEEAQMSIFFKPKMKNDFLTCGIDVIYSTGHIELEISATGYGLCANNND